MKMSILRSISSTLMIIILSSIAILWGGCEAETGRKEINTSNIPGQVNFECSNPALKSAWDWAKHTALSYVREGDPVGFWYEAALPGRDAFCMRDVSHQAMGAAVLGLDMHNRNMLFRFAENISESKDWCSYWEINKHNLPAPVDYRNDKDFWYNLPANFDVIDACFRMFVRTGDSSYLTDPAFLYFYEKSLTEYVDRWDLGANKLLKRQRIMNLPSGATSDNHKYYDKRGIPGYYEGAEGQMLAGIDLPAAQYAAYNWYHYYIAEPSGQGTHFLDEALKIDSLINKVFWDTEAKSFKSIWYADGHWDHTLSGSGQDFSHYLLHFKAIDDKEKINSILDLYSKNMTVLNIELSSHLPEIFFNYGRPEDGVFMLMYLADSTTPRREYPENSFAVTGAFIHGLMGVNINVPDNFISTFSGFTDPYAWGMVEDLPMAKGSISLMHRGRHTSMLTNHTSDTLSWQIFLEAGPDIWFINGEENTWDGTTYNWYGTDIISWMVRVEPGEAVSVSAFPR